MSGARHWEQDKESTLYVGNLDERMTDAMVWELMLQMGPVINVHLPKDRVTQNHQSYGFVEFASVADAEYAEKIMNGVRVMQKPLRVNKASADNRRPGEAGGAPSIGAELFIGNLDTLVDEKTLYETFERFGPLMSQPKIARDEAGLSKGYGFVSYASFDASDDAIANMHGQFLSNKEVTVQYAFKKDGKGERHGDEAERALAKRAQAQGIQVEPAKMPGALLGFPTEPHAMQNVANGPPQPHGGYGGGYGNGGQFGHVGYQGYGVPPVNQGYGGLPVSQGLGASNGQYGAVNHYQQPPPNYGQHSIPHAPPQGLPPNASLPPAPQRHFSNSPHTSAPSGLPARPPPSVGGYGGPPSAPGMQQSFHGQGPPQLPPGMPPSMPPGLPPGLPPGMPPPPGGYGYNKPPQNSR